MKTESELPVRQNTYIVNKLEDNFVFVPGGFVSSQAANVSYQKRPKTHSSRISNMIEELAPYHPLHSSPLPTSVAIDDCKSFQTAMQLPGWPHTSLPLLKQASY